MAEADEKAGGIWMKAFRRSVSILLSILFLTAPLTGVAGGALPFHEDPDAAEEAAKSVLMLTVYDSKGKPFATGSGTAAVRDVR